MKIDVKLRLGYAIKCIKLNCIIHKQVFDSNISVFVCPEARATKLKNSLI